MNVFCGLLAAVLYADTEWVKLLKEKAEIHHLREMASLPTVTVFAKWFVFDPRARLSAAALVSDCFLDLLHVCA
jgi:hypothetical protein